MRRAGRQGGPGEGPSSLTGIPCRIRIPVRQEQRRSLRWTTTRTDLGKHWKPWETSGVCAGLLQGAPQESRRAKEGPASSRCLALARKPSPGRRKSEGAANGRRPPPPRPPRDLPRGRELPPRPRGFFARSRPLNPPRRERARGAAENPAGSERGRRSHPLGGQRRAAESIPQGSARDRLPIPSMRVSHPPPGPLPSHPP